jgi:hypothetical protein
MAARYLLRRYAFAWAFLGCFAASQVGYALLSGPARTAVTTWASTSVVNLEHDPFGCLLFSSVVTGGISATWPVMIAVALFAAAGVAGNRRTLVVCAAGHVVGTLVSEGIVAYRVDTGQLPLADRHLTDVGPSYIVVSALVLALLHGWRRRGSAARGPAARRLAVWGGLVVRVAAAIDLAILIFAGNIFGGLSTLQVAAVGHLTAIVTAGLVELVSEGLARRHAVPGSSREIPARH